ncbi:MAG: hypothetical protein M1114_06420 [Candidatus Dependentiae bacterium]|nr:hypothetical protein [Candidatus Dependentiae bacterium]
MIKVCYLSMLMLIVGSSNGMLREEITPDIVCNATVFSEWLLRETDRCPKELEKMLAAVKVNTGRLHCVHYHLDEKRKIKTISFYSYQRPNNDGFDEFRIIYNPSRITRARL